MIVQGLRPLRAGGAIGVGVQEVAALVELDQRLLVGEARRGRSGSLAAATAVVVLWMLTCDFTNQRPAAAMAMTPRMPKTTMPTTTQTQVLTLPAISTPCGPEALR